MNTTSVIIIALLNAIVGFILGYKICYDVMLNRWIKLFDELHIDKNNYHLAKGILYAYDKVIKMDKK